MSKHNTIMKVLCVHVYERIVKRVREGEGGREGERKIVRERERESESE